MALVDKVREELRRDKVKLWEPPYLPDTDGSLDKLASDLSTRVNAPVDEIGTVLHELQQHALAKLRERRTCVTLTGRMIGVACCAYAPSDNSEMKEECSVEDKGAKVIAGVRKRLGTTKLKIIAGGLPLQEEPTLQEQGWKTDSERSQKPIRVVFIASGKPVYESVEVAETGSAVDPNDNSSQVKVGDEKSIVAARATVAQVREAAELLTAEGLGDFELYDKNTGKMQNMTTDVRQALITAIALHARGRELFATRSRSCIGCEGLSVITEATQSDSIVAEALEFLVEADRCFELCRERGAVQLLDQLENYGQLQLDICWAYALLGDATCLPDALTRLQSADQMLQRQVDANFLVLCGVKADEGKTIPPEAIPSTRLWLLRGIALRAQGAPQAQDDLERAALFMQGLKVSEDSVSGLMGLGATRAQAIAALRRCEGNANRAAEVLITTTAEKKQQSKDREAQRKFGTTANGSYVDPHCVTQLVGMGIDESVAVDALKKSNNDIVAALDVLPRKEPRLASIEIPVDELALAQLLSMGFEQPAIEVALRAVRNNVEEAMIMLTSTPPPIATTHAEHQLGNSTEECKNAIAATESKEEAQEELGKEEKQDETIVTETGALVCSNAGCLRPPWNGKRGEACCRTCSESGGVTHGPDCNYKWRLANPNAPDTEQDRKQRLKDEARAVVEMALGQCLRKSDLDDTFAGADLYEEEAVLQQCLSQAVS